VNFRNPFRRTTAIVAGTFLGLAGAFALVAPASAHVGHLEGKSKCADDGGWYVDWTLTTWKTNNTKGTLSNVQSTKSTTALKNIKDGAEVEADGSLTDSQSFDTDTHQAQISLHISWTDGAQGDVQSKPVWAPRDCTPTTPPTTPPATPPTTPPAAPGTPTPILQEDCTTMTIGLTNPEEGKTVTLDFETKKGETRHTVIQPGETRTEKFSATPGFWVKVTPHGIDDAKPETINYEQPADCDTTGSAGGLPVTGAAAGTIAGGAAILLAAGAVLFVVTRRRKVKFTA